MTNGNGMTQKELLLLIWGEVKEQGKTMNRIETRAAEHAALGDAHDIPELRETLRHKGGALRTVGLSLASSAATALILVGLFSGKAG